MPEKIAAGNWKMNGLSADLSELELIAAHAATSTVVICPSAALLSRAADTVSGRMSVGGQDCHGAQSGAHTGDTSATMIKDAGAAYVIVGHSERRADHGETSETVKAKAQAGLDAGLTPIVCIGETLAEREAGQTLEIVASQLSASLPDGGSVVVAYEPVWAIGTGLTATPDQIAEVHTAMRQQLADIRDDGADIPLLYGGSVKAANAAEIFAVPDVNGALVGGASLKAADFIPIIQALDVS
ncbi:MAG: triose-phosphate isomerase [Planktomarina sp.]